MIIIKKLIKEKSSFKIFVDMDSVLSDFDAMFLTITDEPVKDGWQYQKHYGKKRFWELINKKGIDFWTEMSWMKDGKELWNYLMSLDCDVSVLSAPSSHDEGTSKRGKLIWCKNNLGHNVNVILEDDKFKYSGKAHILIDDLNKNIVPWKQKGGIGILHTSTTDTIQKLKRFTL
jgi:hypothetical protein